MKRSRCRPGSAGMPTNSRRRPIVLRPGSMFAIELVVPAFIFSGRRLRLLAAAIFAAFQVRHSIDRQLHFLQLADHFAVRAACWMTTPCAGSAADGDCARNPLRRAQGGALALAGHVMFDCSRRAADLDPVPGDGGCPARAGLRPSSGSFTLGATVPQSFNDYGLFAVMTQTRPEISAQGSDDGRTGGTTNSNTSRATCGARRDSSRLISRAWIGRCGLPPWRRRAATPWFYHFEYRLLQNSPPVLALLGPESFSQSPAQIHSRAASTSIISPTSPPAARPAPGGGAN